MINQWKSLCC